MNKNVKVEKQYFTIKSLIVVAVTLTAMVIVTSGFKNTHAPADDMPCGALNQDSVESVAAFSDVYKVLMSPRCMNCHPAGDIPLQGDDNHLHTMLPKRGIDGKGLYAMKCANCHQPQNTPGLHTPPGNPNWHLPPSSMKMVFQGKTPNELARQLTDPEKNGHKNKKQLLDHANDGLVKGAWNPGDGRTLPPISHEAFARAWATWIEKGAYAPNP